MKSEKLRINSKEYNVIVVEALELAEGENNNLSKNGVEARCHATRKMETQRAITLIALIITIILLLILVGVTLNLTLRRKRII